MTDFFTKMEDIKKPKRPRIGSMNSSMAGSENGDIESRYEKVNYPTSSSHSSDDANSDSSARMHTQRNYGYNQRPNNYGQRQNNYGQRQNNYGQQRSNGYNQGYQNRNQGYQNRQENYQYHNQEDGNTGSTPNSNYTQRPSNYGQRQNNGYGQRQNNGYGQRQNNGYGQRQNNGYGQRQNNGYGQQRQNNGYGQRQNNGYGQRQNNGYGQRPNNGYGQRQNNGYGQQRPGQNRYNNNRNQGMKFMPRPKQIDYVLEDIDPNEEVRLNKYMANAGICSRREADEFITAGKVKVNGEVVTELGTKITRDDVVEFEEKVVTPERKCYVLLNKPKDCVTTSDDPNGRTTVLDIVKNACQERIYPVGRLDRNTTGVLLLTNDGDLASKLTHPKFVKKKIYHVWTDKPISEEDMQRIADGIELEDGEIHADAISYVSETERNQAGIEIHSGRNRIVRRIFEHLGYRVTKLDRVYFAGLTKKNLPRGRWRYLTQEEVNYLRMGAFE